MGCEAQITAIFTEAQFRIEVSALLNRSVSRTRLWELRRELGSSEPLTYDHARAIAFFAQLRRNRTDITTAREKTIAFCKEYGL